jgi:hypothetical protein
MSEGDNQTSTLHGQPDQDRLQPHSPAQQQSAEDFNGIGENGTNDLGDFGNIAGGVGGSAGETGSGGSCGMSDEGGTLGQQRGQQMDEDGRKLFSRNEDEDDLGDGAGASSAAGSAI